MKRLLTGVIYNNGGTSAKEYRRITIGAGWFDELAAFPSDVEGEGRAFNLGLKRIEGSPYGKMMAGSTPRIKTSGPGSCQIDERVNMAQEVFVYHIPCPECGREHALEFGATVAEKHACGYSPQKSWVSIAAEFIAARLRGCLAKINHVKSTPP